MWSEEMDKRVQEAMSQEPAFDEKSWEKMLPILDEHLPEKKKKRRFLFFLLFFTGIATGLLCWNNMRGEADQNKEVLAKNASNASSTTSHDGNEGKNTTDKNDNASAILTISSVGSKADEETSANNDNVSTTSKLFIDQAGDAMKSTSPVKQSTGVRSSTISSTTKKNVSNQVDRDIPSKQDVSSIVSTTDMQQQQLDKQQVNDVPLIKNTDQQQSSLSSSTSSTGNSRMVDSSSIEWVAATADPVASTDSASITNQKEDSTGNKVSTPDKPKKEPKGFRQQFSVSLSLAPEYASTGFLSDGKWRWQYGVGLQYHLNRRLAIRTGLYAGRKVYAAAPADYHPPAAFWNYYPGLEKVDANCMILEVPIGIAYDFKHKGPHAFFGSVGIASVWMKNETYEYYYKYNGQPAYRERSFKNENQHLFSTAQVSIGYRYQLSSKLFLQAEPYFKRQLSGIGYGKVKLNSTGVLFSVGFYPFSKK